MYKPAGATIELDFLGVGTTSITTSTMTRSPFQKFLERGRSFRGVQQVGETSANIPNLLTSDVLKSVIAAGKFTAAAPENAPQKTTPKPMTVFYGGSVAVFDVTPEKFESIVKVAMEEKLKPARASNRPTEPKQHQPVNVEDPNDDDLPIARKKSLQRFLEKRKERLNTVSPYGCRTNNS